MFGSLLDEKVLHHILGEFNKNVEFFVCVWLWWFGFKEVCIKISYLPKKKSFLFSSMKTLLK